MAATVTPRRASTEARRPVNGLLVLILLVPETSSTGPQPGSGRVWYSGKKGPQCAAPFLFSPVESEVHVHTQFVTLFERNGRGELVLPGQVVTLAFAGQIRPLQEHLEVVVDLVGHGSVNKGLGIQILLQTDDAATVGTHRLLAAVIAGHTNLQLLTLIPEHQIACVLGVVGK